MEFPKDFNKMPHPIAIIGGYHWTPKNGSNNISIVGGGYGAYGNGVDTFEIMVGDENPLGWQTVEQINKLIKDL